MMRSLLWLAAVAGVIAGALVWWVTETTSAQSGPSLEGDSSMAVPEYDARGELRRPEGYREWVFVGASLGLRYPEDGEPAVVDDGPGTFHNVYIQPEAYRRFLEDGVFPEKTILAMETYETGTREPKSNLTGGFYEADFAGLSAAVKDSDHYEDGWGYVTFGRGLGVRLADSAAAFPRERCFDCHAEHGATDNVFTQFYPILRDARP